MNCPNCDAEIGLKMDDEWYECPACGWDEFSEDEEAEEAESEEDDD